MKIFVLGSTGMLGHYVYAYLHKTYTIPGSTIQVYGISRENLNAYHTDNLYFNDFFNTFCIQKDDVIINCIGIIKQRKDVPNLEYVNVNTVFPLKLAKKCAQNDVKLIHITTDCVFSGDMGLYTESSVHDAEDVYGKSKSLGESDNCTVIRTSIIGEETKSFLSLIEWVKSNAGKEVSGYVNHFWNGITCLQFAKICETIINDNLYWKGVRHVFSPQYVSKDELVKMISDVYDLDVKVKEVNVPRMCNRTLSTNYDIIFNIPDLLEQLKEQKKFGDDLLHTTTSGTW